MKENQHSNFICLSDCLTGIFTLHWCQIRPPSHAKKLEIFSNTRDENMSCFFSALGAPCYTSCRKIHEESGLIYGIPSSLPAGTQGNHIFFLLHLLEGV